MQASVSIASGMMTATAAARVRAWHTLERCAQAAVKFGAGAANAVADKAEQAEETARAAAGAIAGVARFTRGLIAGEFAASKPWAQAEVAKRKSRGNAP